MKRKVVQENQGELEDLIAGLEGGKSPAKRRRPRRESREVVVREYNDSRSPRALPSMTPSPRESGGGLGWLFLWETFAIFVLIGIFSYPLQTIAACAVLFVLFVPVVFYWTTANAGNVMSSPVDGGVPQPIASGQNRPQGIAANSAFAYWADSITGNIMEARFGGTSGPLATAQYLSTSVVLDDSNLSWLTYASSATVDQTALNGTGKPITLITEATEYFGLTIDGSNIYCGSSNGIIRSIKKGGGASPTTIASGLFSPQALAVDQTSVYWANDEGTIMKAPLTGTTSPVTLASGQANPFDIKVDATSVYWSGAAGVTKATPKQFSSAATPLRADPQLLAAPASLNALPDQPPGGSGRGGTPPSVLVSHVEFSAGVAQDQPPEVIFG